MPALVLVIVIAAAIALHGGARGAGQALGEKYRHERERKLAAKGLADKGVAMGYGKRAKRAGVAAGALAATSVGGGRIAAHAFGRGWRLGWRLGKRRAAAWLQRQGGSAVVAGGGGAATATAPDPATPEGAATPATPAPATPPATPATPPPATPARGIAPNTKGKPMAIETKTGGEITTRSGLIAELEAAKAEALAEHEDAAGDEKRAKEDVARVDLILASLTALKIDDETIKAVGALAETNDARVNAVKARQLAASDRLAAASTALTAVHNSAQGAFHTN